MSHLIIDCLRHGTCEGPQGFRGRSDVALNAAGWQQMRDSAAQLPVPDRIVSSPLQRCARLAEELAARWGVPLLMEPDLREMDFGDWDGLDLAQLSKDQPQALADFWRDPGACPPPNAEPLADFDARLTRGWQTLLADASARHLLLVTHAGVIKTLLAQLTGMDRTQARHLHRVQVAYAGVTRFRIDRDEQGRHWPHLLFHGVPGVALPLPG